MKTVLIITYYWPPAGGIEVHRVVKFCKYLMEFGYKPIILTVKNSTATATDPAFQDEVEHITPVTRAPSVEPHTLFYALTGRKKRKSIAPANKKEAPSGFASTLGEFIRLNFFIPDARIGWAPAAIRSGHQLVMSEKPDLIFSTAPPYTVHLIASRLSRKHGIPWVADFRDPWVENYAYNTQYRFPWVRWINERLERRVLNQANRVVVATAGQKILQGAKTKDGEKRFCTITNGHDIDTVPEATPSDVFLISYYGSISAQRVPVPLFDCLRSMIQEDPSFAADFRFRFAGRITSEARTMIESRLPESNREFLSMLPHKDYLKKVIEHQVLLVFVDQVPHNDMILPAKCLEMIITGNPILAFGPLGGDTDRFLQDYTCGTLLDTPTSEQIRSIVLEAYQSWKQGALNLGSRPMPELHRKNLTQDLANVFKDVLFEAGSLKKI